MFKFLKKLFKAKDDEFKIAEEYLEKEYKKRIENERLLKKTEWYKKNELAKKHDACNLGMTRTNNNRLYDLSQMQQLAAAAQNAQIGQYNPYTQYGNLSSISGSIFH